jgi:hypothetical protein
MSNMWKHYCLEEKEDIDIGEGEECNWCGLDAEAISIDGFTDAIIGHGEQYNNKPLNVYSYSRICGILRDRDGMSWEEADEYAQFNITNVWVGERTPMILYNEYWYDWKDDESNS